MSLIKLCRGQIETRRHYWVLAACLFLQAFSQPSLAKDLSKRLGLGIRNNMTVDVPMISANYYFGKEVGISAAFGVDTQDENSRMAIAFGVRRNIFFEPNLNFYMGGQVATVSFEKAKEDLPTETEKLSGIEADVFVGTEFFFAGLDSVGFTFESGFGVATTGKTRFRTIADHPFRAGIHFYF